MDWLRLLTLHCPGRFGWQRPRRSLATRLSLFRHFLRARGGLLGSRCGQTKPSQTDSFRWPVCHQTQSVLAYRMLRRELVLLRRMVCGEYGFPTLEGELWSPAEDSEPPPRSVFLSGYIPTVAAVVAAATILPELSI